MGVGMEELEDIEAESAEEVELEGLVLPRVHVPYNTWYRMTNSGCGWTFHDHVATPPRPGPLLSSLTSTREDSHDALEMIKDLKKNPLALRDLTSVELEESLVPPALELELCLTDIKQELLHVAITFRRMRIEE
jgi:hypothetical protein